MEITWLGHAAIRVRSGATALVMDPYPEALGLRIPPQQAQARVVTISSADPNHSAIDTLTNDTPPVLVDGPGEYEAAGFRIRGVRTTRQGTGDEQAWNTVYVVEVEGIVLCHLGNPDRLLTAAEIEELGSPHILVLPVGSRNGVSAADAVELINAISPRIVVPVMFVHPGNKVELRELGPFLQELGAKAPEQQARLTVTRTALPEETEVALLQPAGTLL